MLVFEDQFKSMTVQWLGGSSEYEKTLWKTKRMECGEEINWVEGGGGGER